MSKSGFDSDKLGDCLFVSFLSHISDTSGVRSRAKLDVSHTDRGGDSVGDGGRYLEVGDLAGLSVCIVLSARDKFCSLLTGTLLFSTGVECLSMCTLSALGVTAGEKSEVFVKDSRGSLGAGEITLCGSLGTGERILCGVEDEDPEESMPPPSASMASRILSFMLMSSSSVDVSNNITDGTLCLQ